MRTIGKILRWFIGIIVILMGWASTETDKITGILWILTGLLILPAVSKRIPQFKNRKAVLLVVCICLFVAGGMASSGQEQMPKTDQVGQAGGTDSSKKINKESKENEKTDGKKAVEPEITEGDTDRDADTVSDIRTETDASNNAVPTYSEETIKESLKVYSYEENPYYLEGLQRYVDGFNGLYVEMNAEQEVKILPLENILKEADVSWNMRRKILELEGKDILTNADFRRMEEKEDEDLFSILFSSKGPYLEVSSKAKDDIDE